MVLSSGGSRGLGGLTPPPFFFFAFQYMKIPADLDPKRPPPPLKNSGRESSPPRRIPRSAPANGGEWVGMGVW